MANIKIIKEESSETAQLNLKQNPPSHTPLRQGYAGHKVSEGSRLRQGINIPKPRKRMRSVWVVLLTAFITAVLAGGGTVGYFYWKDNFLKPKEDNTPKEEVKAADKIKGKNLVVVTSDEEKLFLNFISLEDGKVINKEIKLDATIRGGKWSEDNKNALVQSSADGKNFILAEKKEKNFSDNEAFFRFVKTDIEGTNKETFIDSSDYKNFGNFVLSGDKIYYLKGRLKEKKKPTDKDTQIWDLVSFNLKTKKEENLAQDIGNFFQGALEYRDGKILSLYKNGSKFYEASFDTTTNKLDKALLFSYKKTKDFDLAIENIFPSSSRQTFIYKDYTAKDGYLLKSYNLATKKTEILVKDKNFSFDKVSWLSEDEVMFLKTPVFSNSTADTKNEIVKLNLSLPNVLESLASSSNILTPIISNDASANSLFFLDGEKLIYLKDKDKKEFQVKGLSQSSDTLFAGIFDY